eukprot:2886220-Pyramimonas_sp.AAC.1
MIGPPTMYVSSVSDFDGCTYDARQQPQARCSAHAAHTVQRASGSTGASTAPASCIAGVALAADEFLAVDEFLAADECLAD